jgi:hypothetical protein
MALTLDGTTGISATGNIVGNNIIVTNSLTAGTFSPTNLSATGNVTGGNLLTGGIVSATGNITGSYILGNGSQLTGVNATQIINGTSNARVVSSGGNIAVGIGGTANVAVFATTGAFITGLVSATGNVSGGNLNVTGNIVDTGALTILTGSNGNLTLNAGTGFIIASSGILNGQANGTGNIGNATGYFNTVFGKATTAQYADLAEMYSADANYLPGTVLDFGGNQEVTISTVIASNRVAGVVSTNPAHLMNSVLTAEYPVAVALTGRVPTSVVGTVSKGDMMISSGNGVAMACSKPEIGTVIGKALEDFSGNSGVIEIVVGRL